MRRESTPKTRLVARAAAIAMLLAGATAVASPIQLTTNPTGGQNSHINPNGTNSGNTTFFNVPLVFAPTFGTYNHQKIDEPGRAEAYVTYVLSQPTVNSAKFDITKTGLANNPGNGAWSSANGFIYFQLATSATFTLDSTVTATNSSQFIWALRQYDTNASAFASLAGNNIVSPGNAVLAQVAGSIGPGVYEFEWNSRNSGPFVFGNFAQDIVLELNAAPLPLPPQISEPEVLPLVVLGMLAGFATSRRRRTARQRSGT